MNEDNERESSFAKKVLRGAARVARGTALSQISRIRVAADRRTAQELKQLDWARAVIDEGARLSKASLEYSVQLGAAWRTLTLDAWRAALGGDAASDGTAKKG
jgi:Zn finger protein HypA/HybF involved in hydrogenase expression